jgi:hypothetical protein
MKAERTWQREGTTLSADFVAKVAGETDVSRSGYFANVVAAPSCRSLQLERRL